MEFKFYPDDKVWVMYKNKPRYTKVLSVVVRSGILFDKRFRITYNLQHGRNIPEDEVFKTREELINSLI